LAWEWYYAPMNDGQHFFLSAAGESMELAKPRECWEIESMRGADRRDHMLISIEPPYRDPHGIGYRDVYKLIIAPRYEGYSLYPISSWPCHVFVFLIADENVNAGSEIRPEQVRNVAWAILFHTLADAENHFKRHS
jgi:hypothetical protein